MSRAAAALSPASATKWSVVDGPMKGTVRLMNAAEFYIGRAAECEFIIINDPKVSRKHALVESNGTICQITTLTDKNVVMVNGREIEKAPLKNGDIVTIGDTQIQFHVTASAPEAALTRRPQGQLHSVPPPGPRSGPRPQSPRPAAKKSGNGRLIFYGLIGLLGYWLFSGSGAKKKELEIRTEKQIQADIEADKKLKEANDLEVMKRGDRSVVGVQAQENFVRGLRDYKKGQYERALISFQSCLALSPEHPLCNRYQRLAQRKFDETVQFQMILGRKYKEQNQFQSCRASFRNVMVMIKDPNSTIYKEAKANFELCNARLEDRY
jgi:hypothetical protein